MPFGWYRWNWIPFLIQSAPEVFRQKRRELIQGILHVKVVADFLVVVGCGDTHKQAVQDHDKNLMTFLQLRQDYGLKFNVEKLKLRQTEVSFIGHNTTSEWLQADQAKVEAICNMLASTDKAGVQSLLSLLQYLSKDFPNLANVTKLRELTHINGKTHKPLHLTG